MYTDTHTQMLNCRAFCHSTHAFSYWSSAYSSHKHSMGEIIHTHTPRDHVLFFYRNVYRNIGNCSGICFVTVILELRISQWKIPSGSEPSGSLLV